MAYRYTPNVDLTRQRVKITPLPGAPATQAVDEVWTQDVIMRVFKLLGFHDVTFSVETPPPPANKRSLWYDVGTPPTGLPGAVKRYDFVLEQWVAMDPQGYIDTIALVARAITHPGDTAPVNPREGDWWFYRSEARLYHYTVIVPGTLAWVDVTGAGIDISAIVSSVGTANTKADTANARVDALLAGSSGALDTFIEVLNADNSILAVVAANHVAALAAAATAQTTANTAVTNAAAAQSTANTGVTNAATAQASANAAQSTANTGVTSAATAQAAAVAAQATASAAAPQALIQITGVRPALGAFFGQQYRDPATGEIDIWSSLGGTDYWHNLT